MKTTDTPRTNAHAAWFLLLTLGLTACGGSRGESGSARHEDHDADHEGEVHLPPRSAAAAGIRTVVAAPALIESTLHLTAQVASNEDTIVHVTPRLPGIVQSIHARLGEDVEKDDPLVEIWSLELGNLMRDFEKMRAMTQAAEETLERTRELYQRRIATLTTVLDGEIAVARKIHEREEALQEKAITTTRPLLQAEKELQGAILTKDRELTTLAADRDERLLELEVELRRVRIEEKAAKDRLTILGVTEEDLEEALKTPGRHGRLMLRAPRSGVVLDRHVTLQEHVDTETALFTIHDMSTVWVLAAVYEKDIAKVRPRQKAHIWVDTLPGTRFEGELTLISPTVAPATRTATVRIQLSNDPVDAWPVPHPLRPGMFGNVQIVTDSWQGRVVLPESAIVHEGDKTYLFVRDEDEDGAYVRREVEVRAGTNQRVEIVRGVDPGEAVVVEGTFTLKSLARGEELGEGHSH